MSDDEKHLDLLAIFHYVIAAFTALMACFPGIYLVFGILIICGAPFANDQNADVPPEIFGWILIVFGSLFMLMAWTYAFALFWAGRSLHKRHGHLFCLIMAGFSCLSMPFGTILGVFTIIVLMRPSVKLLFEHGDTEAPEETVEWE